MSNRRKMRTPEGYRWREELVGLRRQAPLDVTTHETPQTDELSPRAVEDDEPRELDAHGFPAVHIPGWVVAVCAVGCAAIVLCGIATLVVDVLT